MSGCEFCKGGSDENLNKTKQDARQYAEKNNKEVIVYFQNKEFKFMEAAAFFERPEGQIIDCLSPLR